MHMANCVKPRGNCGISFCMLKRARCTLQITNTMQSIFLDLVIHGTLASLLASIVSGLRWKRRARSAATSIRLCSPSCAARKDFARLPGVSCRIAGDCQDEDAGTGSLPDLKNRPFIFPDTGYNPKSELKLWRHQLLPLFRQILRSSKPPAVSCSAALLAAMK